MFFFPFPRSSRVVGHNKVPPDSSSGKCMSRHDLHGKLITDGLSCILTGICLSLRCSMAVPASWRHSEALKCVHA